MWKPHHVCVLGSSSRKSMNEGEIEFDRHVTPGGNKQNQPQLHSSTCKRRKITMPLTSSLGYWAASDYTGGSFRHHRQRRETLVKQGTSTTTARRERIKVLFWEGMEKMRCRYALVSEGERNVHRRLSTSSVVTRVSASPASCAAATRMLTRQDQCIANRSPGITSVYPSMPYSTPLAK